MVAVGKQRLPRKHPDAIHHLRTWWVTRCGQRPGRVRWTAAVNIINCEDCLAELKTISAQEP